MRRHALSIALMSILLGACSSVSEKPSDNDQVVSIKTEEELPVTVKEKPSKEVEEKEVPSKSEGDKKDSIAKDKPKPLITGHKWTTLEFKDQKSLVGALREVGLSLGKMVAPSDTDAVINSEALRGDLVTIISDEEGVVLSLYGKTESGDVMSLVNADGSFVLSKVDGPIMEPVIRLSVTPRSSIERLGLTQKLALKQVFSGKEREDAQSILANESVNISFKALFVQGRMIGPIEIVSFERH